jgi:hypothetical protein
MGMKKATIKLQDNVSAEEITQLFEGLKKIEGFEFGISGFILCGEDMSTAPK